MTKKMDSFKAIIAHNLQILRVRKGWVQEYVGELLGSYYAYQRLEQGVSTLKIEDAIKLSKIYDVPVEALWRDESQEAAGVVSDAERGTYQKPKNSVNMSVVLDGDAINLEKQIELLKNVNKLLVNDNG